MDDGVDPPWIHADGFGEAILRDPHRNEEILFQESHQGGWEGSFSPSSYGAPTSDPSSLQLVIVDDLNVDTRNFRIPNKADAPLFY